MRPMQRIRLGLLRADIKLGYLTLDKKWDELKHPRRKDGKFGKGVSVKSDRRKQVKRDIMRSMEQTGVVNGKTKVILGFETAQKPIFDSKTTSKSHDKRHEKHAKDMGLSFRQWIVEAANLLNDDASEDYLDWYEPKRGIFRRYNKRNGRLVAGSAEGTINTYFILPSAARKNYFPDKYLEIFFNKG